MIYQYKTIYKIDSVWKNVQMRVSCNPKTMFVKNKESDPFEYRPNFFNHSNRILIHL